MSELVLRLAEPGDRAALGRMGVALARLHHELDPARFMLIDDEDGYGGWLVREAASRRAVVVVAERAGELVGYGYGRLEGTDWARLLAPHGELVDLWVDERARGDGAGARLVEEVARRLAALGAPRLVLSAAAANTSAQGLFARLGFRPTMIEMTREL